MKVGVVDIGTNSMRLLVTDGREEMGRWIEVTGLGRGLDASGALSEEAMENTLDALRAFGSRMDRIGVDERLAIATSASRDASNRDHFFDQVEEALGVRPTLISGEREGRYAFSGARAGLELTEPLIVTDIGGGSTEFVTASRVRSVDIGTVRLSDRSLHDRPPTADQVEQSIAVVRSMFSDIETSQEASHVGVAGTWTSLAAIALGLDTYRKAAVHGSTLTLDDIGELVDLLLPLDLSQTRQIPSLDPRRAPVILPGALIARELMKVLGANETIVSESDTLDGAAMELIGIA